MVDCAVDSMSGLTSQPSMGALVGSLAGTELDTGIDPRRLLLLSDYWEATREVYAPFEANMRWGGLSGLIGVFWGAGGGLGGVEKGAGGRCTRPSRPTCGVCVGGGRVIWGLVGVKWFEGVRGAGVGGARGVRAPRRQHAVCVCVVGLGAYWGRFGGWFWGAWGVGREAARGFDAPFDARMR